MKPLFINLGNNVIIDFNKVVKIELKTTSGGLYAWEFLLDTTSGIVKVMSKIYNSQAAATKWLKNLFDWLSDVYQND